MKNRYLDAFEPFCDLDEKSKLVASKFISSESIKNGEYLFNIGDEDTVEYFLASGEIELLAEDGRNKVISSSDHAAKFPLALLRPRKFSALTRSDSVRIIKIDMQTLAQIRSAVPVAGDEISAFSLFSHSEQDLSFSAKSDDDAIDTFLNGASKAITDNRLNIANFDDVSSTIYNVIQTPDVSIDEVVAAVQLDAAVSAKLIKAANSAFFGGMAKVDSVRAALVRLGLDLAVQLVSVMVLKEVFHSSSENLQEAMHKLWLSSLKLATYSVIVGKRSAIRFQQGQCLLAGLMNDIGTLVIISYLDQFPGSFNMISEQALSSSNFKRKLGYELLEHWKFPLSIIESMEKANDYLRDIDQADICDVVCIAKLLIRQTSYRKLPVDDITQTKAFHRLGFDSENPHLLQDIQEEADKYLALFTGAF